VKNDDYDKIENIALFDLVMAAQASNLDCISFIDISSKKNNNKIFFKCSRLARNKLFFCLFFKWDRQCLKNNNT